MRDEIRDTILDLIPAEPDAAFLAVELGVGAGWLSEAILARFPAASVLGFDGSPTMLRATDARLQPFAGRFALRPFRLEDRSWLTEVSHDVRCFVSSLVIHHLDAAGKQALYRDLYAHLAPEGAVLIADLVAPVSERERRYIAQRWDAEVERQSLAMTGSDTIYRAFVDGHSNWYTYPDPVDMPSTVAEHIAWLTEAGFVGVDVFWARAGHVIYGGYKPGTIGEQSGRLVPAMESQQRVMGLHAGAIYRPATTSTHRCPMNLGPAHKRSSGQRSRAEKPDCYTGESGGGSRHTREPRHGAAGQAGGARAVMAEDDVTTHNRKHDTERALTLDRPREECGVFGIYAPGEDVSRLTYFGLYALQHRGQESAGIACGDGKRLSAKRDMGLVSQVFDEEALRALHGHLAIGHTRYSTTGSSNACNAQPVVLHDRDLGPFALGHNGNLVNTRHLRDRLSEDGTRFETSTDSEVIAQLVVAAGGPSWAARITRSLPKLMGAYSLVMATPSEVFAARDPLGVRPLCLGRLGDGWVVASETCALDTIGAAFEREVAPGEVVRIDASGLTSLRFGTDRPALCSFEYIYFARPDSVVGGQRVYDVRVALGRALAREQPAEADVVIPVPDSAVPAAVGYAAQSGIPYGEGLIKNRYIGRTFIAPDQRLRDVGIGLKFNPLPGQLEGKRVVVIEDSIVRGSTSKPIVQLLRKAGAREVHLRISSPPYRHPCFLGMDTGRREELIAARLSVEDIREHIGADSLGYLSVEGMLTAMGRTKSTTCLACLDGDYPLPIQMEMDKLALE